MEEGRPCPHQGPHQGPRPAPSFQPAGPIKLYSLQAQLG